MRYPIMVKMVLERLRDSLTSAPSFLLVCMYIAGKV